jgi:putative redox protein
MVKIEVDRVSGDYGFEATDAYGHKVRIDNSPEGGGNNFGVRPMQLLLMGLGGCSGIDIISILKKQRQVVKRFSMHIDGQREIGKEPSLWEKVKITFELEGDIDPDKANRACQLSMDKYCSVAETLRKAGGQLEWEVRIVES